MCRWFAYISPTEPCLLSDVLITPANSISKQCSEHYLPKLLPHGDEKELDHTSDELLRMRNSLLNMDGLGVACTCTSHIFRHITIASHCLAEHILNMYLLSRLTSSSQGTQKHHHPTLSTSPDLDQPCTSRKAHRSMTSISSLSATTPKPIVSLLTSAQAAAAWSRRSIRIPSFSVATSSCTTALSQISPPFGAT